MNVFVDPRRLTLGVLRAPPSKSDAIRALATAFALDAPTPRLDGNEDDLPEDVVVFARALEGLRSNIGGEIDCRDGGAPFRFALALAAAITRGEVTFTGSARLGQRPHAPLVEALRGAGARIELLGQPWPIRVRGIPDAPGNPMFLVDPRDSSQFASALLFAAAARSRMEGRRWSIELRGELASAGYLDLTIAWLRRAGVRVEQSGARITVDSSERRSDFAKNSVPADWSSLAYLLLIAWRTGAVVHGLDPACAHPDRAILELLAAVGLTVFTDRSGTRVQGTPTRGLRTSIGAFPDLALTLAALACALPEPSRLDEVAILRHKESDRVEGCRALVEAFGGKAMHLGNALEIEPPRSFPARAHFEANGDHRRALAATTLSIVLGVELELTGAECVRKSFPSFFRVLGLDPIANGPCGPLRR